MRSRDLITFGLLVVFGAAIALFALEGGQDAPGPGIPNGLSTPRAGGSPNVDPAPGPATAPVPVPAGTGAEPAAATPRVDTSGWTRGVIRGDIRLAVSVLDRLDSITVIVRELRSGVRSGEPPFQKFVKVERGKGTPTFEVRDIPFSPYPYAVSVHAPGLNGSRRTLTIDEKTPFYDDVVLEITPGAPYSILVRDQSRNPYADVEVRLIPTGDVPGRGEHIGRTDALGNAVFENVLAGDYRVVLSRDGQPIAPPRLVTVQPGARRYGTKVQGQGETLVIPRGMPLEVLVSTTTGYGIEGAAVRLQALDDASAKPLERATDSVGRATFPYLTPGRWMLNVTKPDHAPFTRPLRIAEGELPPRQEVRLRRVR